MLFNNISCPNPKCNYFSIPQCDNLKIKQYQGKKERIALMQCTECGKTFSERQGTLYFGLKRTPDEFDLVIQLSVCRVSIKDIERITGVSEDTIQRWLKKASAFLLPIHDRLLRDLQVTECQIDEMWSFVLMKKKTVLRQGIEEDDEIGDQWIFLAVDVVTKLVLHWTVGKRTIQTAKFFLASLKSRLATSPLFTTDEWLGYEKAFLDTFAEDATYEPEVKTYSEKPKPKKMTNELKLAQTHKQRKHGRVVDVTEKIVFGDPDEIDQIIQNSPVSNSINTSIVERCNGTVRAKVSRFVRQTYSFSKKFEMHIDHLIIYFVYYNFIWKNSRLGKTAAFLSGIAPHAYTFRQLFTMRE